MTCGWPLRKITKISTVNPLENPCLDGDFIRTSLPEIQNKIPPIIPVTLIF